MKCLKFESQRGLIACWDFYEAHWTLLGTTSMLHLLTSVPTPEDAVTLMEQLIELCAKCGFNLAKFVSNNRKVFSAIPRGKRADSSLDVSRNVLAVDRALEVRWQKESDTFGFRLVELGKVTQ